MKREEEIKRHGEALAPQLHRLTDPVQRPLALQGELLKNRLDDGARPKRTAHGRRWLAAACTAVVGVIVVCGALLAQNPLKLATASGGASPEDATETAMLMENAAGAEEGAGAGMAKSVVPDACDEEFPTEGAAQAVPQAQSYQEIMDRILEIEGQGQNESGMPLNADAGAAMPRGMTMSAPAPAAQTGEGDILQNDGEYLYYLTVDEESMLFSSLGHLSSTLYIVRVSDLSLVSSTGVEGTGELYLEGDSLLLVGEDSVFPGEDRAGEETPWTPVTSAKIYDVSNPAQPEIRSDFIQEGTFVSCQVQDGVAYLVSEWVPDAQELDDSQQAAPRTSGGAGEEERRLTPDEVLLPAGAQSASFAVVSALDLAGDVPAATRAVLGGATAVYLSEENLYIAGTRYGEGEASDWTELLRFEPDTLDCAAEGRVEGILSARSSMDEYGGYLRLTATAGEEIRLYVLDMGLRECSSVRGFAEDAALGGVLYRGDTAYVSAVREGEELWVLDLGDPQNPKTRGSLAQSGFSQQLFALDEHTLLGFGLDTLTGEDGVLYSGGVRLSVYDVSDPDRPALGGQAVLGERASSEALYEPRALLLEGGRIGFAAELRAADMDGSEQTRFSGYFLYELKDGKPQEQVRVTLQKSAAESDYATVHILRGTLIGDTLYTVSARRMASFDPKSGETLWGLELE